MSIKNRMGAAAFALTLAAACAGDGISTPSSITALPTASFAKGPGSAGTTIGEDNSGKRAEGLQWTSTAEKAVKGRSVSGTFGNAGGILSIPQAGVRVLIPEGALSSTVVITMKVHNGKTVSYDFSPHGLTFARPLVMTQSLSGTKATAVTALNLALGYYSNEDLADDTGADVDEFSDGWLDVAAWTFTTKIWHFSGYMLASGRSHE